MHCNVKQGRKGRTQGNALIKAAKVIDFSNLLTKNHRETKQENKLLRVQTVKSDNFDISDKLTVSAQIEN